MVTSNIEGDQMNKRIAAAAASASRLAGAAGFAIGVTGTAGAQSDPPTTTAPSTTAPRTPKPNSDARTRETLKPLLDNGTLTQAQIDAVVKALQDARPDGKGPKGGELRGGPGRGASLSTAATALGATEDEVRAALRSGQSLAALATAKGVDPQKVIDALLAPIVEHEKADVASGKDTQAESDKQLADATTRITDFVNGTGSAKGTGIPHTGRGRKGPAPTTTTPGS
jgi:hypothetical protein